MMKTILTLLVLVLAAAPLLAQNPTIERDLSTKVGFIYQSADPDSDSKIGVDGYVVFANEQDPGLASVLPLLHREWFVTFDPGGGGDVRPKTQDELDDTADDEAVVKDTESLGILDMACMTDLTGIQDVGSGAGTVSVKWDDHLDAKFKDRTFSHSEAAADIQLCVKKPLGGCGIYRTSGNLIITGATAGNQFLVDVRAGGATAETAGGRAPGLPIPSAIVMLGGGGGIDDCPRDCVSVRVEQIVGTGAAILDAGKSRFCLLHEGSRQDENNPDVADAGKRSDDEFVLASLLR